MAERLQRDTKSGTWNVINVADNKVSPSSGGSSGGSSGSSGNSGSSGSSSGSRIAAPEYLDSGSGSSASSGADKSAQDKYDEVTTKICEGTLKPVVALPQMPSRVCLNVLGVGNVLSGKYYVKSTQLTINKSGLTQTINVRKVEFGGSLRLTDDSRDGRPSPLIR